MTGFLKLCYVYHWERGNIMQGWPLTGVSRKLAKLEKMINLLIGKSMINRQIDD
jgi:hypothetical protein